MGAISKKLDFLKVLCYNRTCNKSVTIVTKMNKIEQVYHTIKGIIHMEVFMNLKMKAMQGMVLAGCMVVLGIIAESANTTVASAAVEQREVTTETDYTAGGTAGVVRSLNELEAQALEGLQLASIAQLQVAVVTASEDEIEAIADIPELTAEELAWQNLAMADVKEQMNVRAEASAEAEIVGRLRKGDVAEVIEKGEEWTHIRSGNVDGYVKNEYCVYGVEALAYAKANVDTRVTITGNGVRVRSEASSDSSVVAAVSKGAVLIAETEAESVDGWVAVKYTGKTRYVSADFAELKLATGSAITIEEEQEIARKKAEEEAKRKAAQVTEVTVVQKEAFDATTDEILFLAALIQCEAGSECYEGKVAVGAVVMNRVRSSRYPNSITGVITSPGQFTPYGSGKVDSVMANGPKDSCIQAAQEAINGLDNTGGAVSFRTKRTGHAGLVIGNHVFF